MEKVTKDSALISKKVVEVVDTVMEAEGELSKIIDYIRTNEPHFFQWLFNDTREDLDRLYNEGIKLSYSDFEKVEIIIRTGKLKGYLMNFMGNEFSLEDRLGMKRGELSKGKQENGGCGDNLPI